MKTKLSSVVLLFMLVSTMSFSQEKMMGEIKMFAGNFAPRGWAFCDGQILKISKHSALFSLLGTNYGGDGRITFALPDLRNRTPVHVGEKKDLLDTNNVGQKGGTESTELKLVNVYKGDSEDLIYTVQSGSETLHTRDPYIKINYIIALTGLYPSRD